MYFLKFHREKIKKFNDIFKMFNPWKYKEIFQHMNEFLTDYNTSLYPSHCGNISQPNIICSIFVWVKIFKICFRYIDFIKIMKPFFKHTIP